MIEYVLFGFAGGLAVMIVVSLWRMVFRYCVKM